jgi:hypothetical protein
LEDTAMPRRKLVDTTKDGVGIRNPEQGQVLLQGTRVYFGFDSRHLQKRLDFR